MSVALTLLVAGLATFRLTRLIVDDEWPPVLWARRRVIGMRPDVTVREPGKVPHENHWFLGELVSCPWCASGWVSLGVTGFIWLLNGLPLPVLCWLAVWAVGSMLAAQFHN